LRGQAHRTMESLVSELTGLHSLRFAPQRATDRRVGRTRVPIARGRADTEASTQDPQAKRERQRPRGRQL